MLQAVPDLRFKPVRVHFGAEHFVTEYVMSLWHLPDFFYLQAVQSGISFPLFLAGTLSTSILFTWVFNGTGGSVLMVSILHSSLNASDAFLPLLPQVTGTTLQLALYLALISASAVIVIVFGRLRRYRPAPTSGGAYDQK
jgi:hypothetical protein